MKTIGEIIREHRTRHNMTQEQLASYLNITFQTVSKWKTNLCPSVRHNRL